MGHKNTQRVCPTFPGAGAGSCGRLGHRRQDIVLAHDRKTGAEALPFLETSKHVLNFRTGGGGYHGALGAGRRRRRRHAQGLEG